MLLSFTLIFTLSLSLALSFFLVLLILSLVSVINFSVCFVDGLLQSVTTEQRFSPDALVSGALAAVATQQLSTNLNAPPAVAPVAVATQQLSTNLDADAPDAVAS